MIAALLALAAAQDAPPPAPAAAAPPAVIIDEAATAREEPPPHGAIGMSTAYRISDAVPGRKMEFRKRILHPGAAIGLHRIAHDEVYYVLAGEGEVSAGGKVLPVRAGMAAYLYDGDAVGLRQVGAEPLVVIVAYPVR